MTETTLVSQLIHKARETRKRIMVVGDSMVDRWVHGRVHTGCQDNCVKFVEEREVMTPGGAANAERSLQRWSINTSLYGFASNDCPVKTRYINESGEIVFRADDDGPPERGNDYQWARDLALEMVKHCDAVLLSDYDKGFMSRDFIQSVVSLCRAREIPCVADCKREPEVYDGCVMKANHAWATLWRRCDKGVVTCGGEAPLIDSFCVEYVWPSVSCVNHVGAGDCFAAHLTLSLAYGFSLKDAAAIAHSAGRVYVQHTHNRPPAPEEIEADMMLATQ